jgi:hypothetical protein
MTWTKTTLPKTIELRRAAGVTLGPPAASFFKGNFKRKTME